MKGRIFLFVECVFPLFISASKCNSVGAYFWCDDSSWNKDDVGCGHDAFGNLSSPYLDMDKANAKL